MITVHPKWKFVCITESCDHAESSEECEGVMEVLCTERPELSETEWIFHGLAVNVVGLFKDLDLGSWRDSLHEIMPDGTLKKCVPLPELPVDAKVLVRDSTDAPWKRRHFAKFDSTERIRCWTRGTTSYTGIRTESWKEWKLYEKGGETCRD